MASRFSLPLLAVLGIALALMAPALWNGFPLLYFDSADYLSLGFTWRMPIYRTAGYGFLVLPGVVTHTLWVTLLVQSLFVAWVMVEAWRWLTPNLTGRALVIAVVATLLLTSLPWVVSEIMPDVYTAPAVLLTLILALRYPDLSWPRRAMLGLMLAIACTAHPTHVTMVAGLAACIAVMNPLRRRGLPFAPMRVTPVVVSLVLGTLLSVASNWAITHRLFLAPRTTPVLTMAVLLETGLGQEYLADTCGQTGVRQSVLCPYRRELPANANEFLWHDASFWRAGGWLGMIPEASRDLKSIVQRYPAQFVATALRLSARQLVTVRTGEGFRTMVGFTDGEIRRFYPGDMPRFLAARQQSFPEVADSPIPEINLVHVPAMLLGVVALGGLVVYGWRRNQPRVVTLGVLVLLAYLGNAVICGAVSNPADRYGSRLACLAFLATMALWPETLKRPSREKSSAGG